jgi:hypothetical protein
MSKIQEKLDSLQPYVVGIRYIQGVQLVEASFTEGWIIPESNLIKKEAIEANYYMFFSEIKEISIDDLLDYVKSIIDINIERENKHELLKQKVKELQILFKDNTLSKLKNLSFTFDEQIVPSLLEMDSDILNEIAKEERVIEAPYAADEYEDDEEEEKRISLIEQQEKFNSSKNKNKHKVLNNIELPPRNQKIEVEVYDLPEGMKEGECVCGPEEACPKCMDDK